MCVVVVVIIIIIIILFYFMNSGYDWKLGDEVYPNTPFMSECVY